MVRSHQVLRWMRWRPFAPSSRRGLAMGISTSRARPLWISQKLGWNQANLGKLANWKQSLTLIFSSSLDEHGNLSDKDKDFNDISKISTTGPTNMESGGVSPRASDLFWHDLDSVDELKNTTFPLIHPQRICTKGWILNMFNGHPNTQKSHWYFYSNQFIATFFCRFLIVTQTPMVWFWWFCSGAEASLCRLSPGWGLLSQVTHLDRKARWCQVRWS